MPRDRASKQKIVEPAGWTSQAASRQTAFLRISVLNGKPGGEEYDLAPSSSVQDKGGNVRQVWRFGDYRDMNLFLRCRYRNTDAVLNIDLPRALTTCTVRFRLDQKGASFWVRPLLHASERVERAVVVSASSA